MPPWSLGQVKQRLPLASSPHHVTSPGGTYAEFIISSVLEAVIPDLICGSSKDANSFLGDFCIFCFPPDFYVLY